MPQKNLFRYFAKNIVIVVSLVLIWRGIWYVFDYLDLNFFGTHSYTAIGGFILGLLLLYIPDKDLKEIEKL